jgi:hypothetical protein
LFLHGVVPPEHRCDARQNDAFPAPAAGQIPEIDRLIAEAACTGFARIMINDEIATPKNPTARGNGGALASYAFEPVTFTGSAHRTKMSRFASSSTQN